MASKAEAHVLGWPDNGGIRIRGDVVLYDPLTGLIHCLNEDNEDTLETLCGSKVYSDWRANLAAYITCNDCGLVKFTEGEAVPVTLQRAVRINEHFMIRLKRKDPSQVYP
jgi:hypothetical protein